MKQKIILYLLLQYFLNISVVAESTEGTQYSANLLGISKQHKNIFASISVSINSKSKTKPAQTLKISKSFTDPKNGWTVWFQEEHGVQDQNWQIVESLESPVIEPQATDELQKPAEFPTPPTASLDGDRENRHSKTNNTECQPSITETFCQRVCSGDLIFEDNFDTMNWTTWHREIRIAMDVSDDSEFVSYQNHSENCYVNNGELVITPTLLTEVLGFRNIYGGTLDLRAECTGFRKTECYRQVNKFQVLPPVVSARIRTKRSFEFRFGRVEVRAKMPKGDWLFPLILLEPSENIYGPNNYASGQMKVAFQRGNQPPFDPNSPDISQLFGGPVLNSGRFYDLFLGKSMGNFGDEFHVYALTWTDQDITLEIDGNQYAKIRGEFVLMHKTHQWTHARLWHQGEYMAPFDRKFFITLGVGAGGFSVFPDNSMNRKSTYKKPWSNDSPKAAIQFWRARNQWHETWKKDDSGLRVDYLRVYAL